MDHVVFFPAQDGSAAFRRLATLEEAVRLVEHLRNVEGVDNVSVHALTEVPLEFKAYYKVALPDAAGLAAVPDLKADAQAEATDVTSDEAAGMAPDAASEATQDPSPEAAAKDVPVVAPQANPAVALVPEQEAPKRPASLGFFAR